jgi:hypothetical protein
MAAFRYVSPCCPVILTDVPDDHNDDEGSCSETSENIYQATRYYVSEDSHLHASRS